MFRIAVFTILLFAALFLLGHLMLRILGWKRTIPGAVAWGVVLLFTLLQITAYPLFLLRTSFTLFAWLFTGVLCAAAAISVFLLIRGRETAYRENAADLWREARAQPVLTLLVLAGLAACFFQGFMIYLYTSDDGYYMARSMEAIRQNAMFLPPNFVWTGIMPESFTADHDTSTLEFLKAWMTWASGIHVAKLCRSGLFAVLFLAHFSALYLAAEDLAKEKADRGPLLGAFLFLYILLQVSARKGFSAGYWITHFLWQGKSILPGIVFPMLLHACVRLCDRADEPRPAEWLSAAALLLAGTAVSTVGIFLTPVCFAVMGLSFLVYVRFRNAGKTILMAALAALPTAICAGMNLYTVLTEETWYLTDLGVLTAEDWTRQLMICCGGVQLALFLAGCVYFLIWGDRRQKVLLLLPPAFLLLTFCNPLLIRAVSSYVTTAEVYWRLFWILPLSFVPALAAADALTRVFKKKVALGLLCAFFIAAAAPTRNAWNSGKTPTARITKFITGGRNLRTNGFGLRDVTVRFGKRILNDWTGDGLPVVLAKESLSGELRQYSVELGLAGGVRDRGKLEAKDLLPGTDMTEGELYVEYQNLLREDPDKLCELLKLSPVDYAAFSVPGQKDKAKVFKEAEKVMEEQGFLLVDSFGSLHLWKICRDPAG